MSSVMNLDSVRTIEALRSGVPSDAAIRELTSTQPEIEKTFVEALEDLSKGVGSTPLMVEANFGDGKSHLLHHLRVKAEELGFVTSSIVISPDTPLGNAQVTLKAIAEEARAPGRTGKALIELAASAPRQASSDLRIWAKDASIDDRFRALLRVYEATQDDELRVLILNDIEGRPLAKTRLAQELRALGELSHFDLKSKRNALLAHDRLMVYAQFCKAHQAKGLVVFFDELERVVNFSFKARLAVYEELGWWRSVCDLGTVPIYAVFAQSAGAVMACLDEKGDEARIRSTNLFTEAHGGAPADGMDLLRRSTRLETATPDMLARVQHEIREIYARSYTANPQPIHSKGQALTMRSEIRRWITEWDLARHYPGYAAEMTVDEVTMDATENPDELLSTSADGED